MKIMVHDPKGKHHCIVHVLRVWRWVAAVSWWCANCDTEPEIMDLAALGVSNAVYEAGIQAGIHMRVQEALDG